MKRCGIVRLYLLQQYTWQQKETTTFEKISLDDRGWLVVYSQ
jgi:hypothetical protein